MATLPAPLDSPAAPATTIFRGEVLVLVLVLVLRLAPLLSFLPWRAWRGLLGPLLPGWPCLVPEGPLTLSLRTGSRDLLGLRSSHGCPCQEERGVATEMETGEQSETGCDVPHGEPQSRPKHDPVTV